MTYRAAYRLATARLRAAGIEAAAADARRLLAYVLDLRPGALPDGDAPVDAWLLEAALVRRESREPLAYITRRQGFWSFELAVSSATLIPRADSETLIEAALAALPDRGGVARVLDLGTGTGCLLLAALTEFPASFGVGVDIMQAAATLARLNARSLGLDARTAFLVADWAAALQGVFDLVLCNPPYVEQADIAMLMPEVADHEPASALSGGPDGLAAYATLLPSLPRLLRAGGIACVELGFGQCDAVSALAVDAGLAVVAARADLGGTPRALCLRRAVVKKAFGTRVAGG